MSKHTIILELELDDSGDPDKESTLLAIAEGAVRNAREDYEGEAEDLGGYEGPYITDITAYVVMDGHRVEVRKA